MIGLVEQSAARDPDHPAVVGESRTLTYGELLHQARQVSAGLQELGLTHVALADDDQLTSIVLLLGCAHAGVEVCAMPRAATDDAIRATAERVGSTSIITSRALAGSDVHTTAQVLAAGAGGDPGEAAADGIVLVLTSGTSSGAPRAARHLWSRVLAPVQGRRPTPDQHWLLSYGLNQFGGLQVLFHVFAVGATLHVPDSFQPRHVGKLMGPWAITHASGTPTFWRFALVEMAKGTPPPLVQITLGGEAVPEQVLADIAERFPDAHVSQIYGATEFGVNITVRDGLPGLPLEALTANKHIEFDVRDGELWVRSQVAMLGYRDSGADAPDEDLDTGQWRATGDLVEIVGDRVHFRGRSSEVINVGGVKVHPVPIENRIASVDGVVVVHAYGRPNPVVGNVVAVDYMLAPGFDADKVGAAIRSACEDLPPACRPRSIKVVEDMATTGNKIARGKATS